MTPAPAVALLSGGLDSSTALVHTLTGGAEVPAAVFVNYGQRHIRERQSARAIAEHYSVPLLELDLTSFGASVRSALTSPDVAVPHGHYAQANMALTVVPNRNATMLSAAAGIAASLGAERVITAVHAGDHPIYADCRPDFIDALSAATDLACAVTIEAPFVHRSKTDIAALAGELRLPIDLTWSCYEGGDTHCGRCGTCVERLEAIADAGVTDGTVYADTTFWRTAVGR